MSAAFYALGSALHSDVKGGAKATAFKTNACLIQGLTLAGLGRRVIMSVGQTVDISLVVSFPALAVAHDTRRWFLENVARHHIHAQFPWKNCSTPTSVASIR